MSSKRDMLLGCILIASTPLVVLFLYGLGVPDLMLIIEETIAGILVITFAAGVTLIYRGSSRKEIISKESAATEPKKPSWFSKLFRKPPIKKEKRVEFWQTMIVMVIGGIFVITIALSFPSASIPQKEISTWNITRMTMIGCGIFITALSTWFMATELYARREYHKQDITKRRTADLSVLHAFDDSFQDLKQVTQPKTKSRRIHDFQPKLHNLCKLPWNGDVKHRIEEVLGYIPDRLTDEQHIDNYLQYLEMILSSYGEHVKGMVKIRFLKELEVLYNNPKFKNNNTVLNLLQELHDHSQDYIMKLVDDAAFQWDDERFNALANNIAFWKLNEEDHTRILQYIGWKMESAEKDADEKARIRFEKLEESAKSNEI